jgi:hypothetical protein
MPKRVAAAMSEMGCLTCFEYSVFVEFSEVARTIILFWHLAPDSAEVSMGATIHLPNPLEFSAMLGCLAAIWLSNQHLCNYSINEIVFDQSHSSFSLWHPW